MNTIILISVIAGVVLLSYGLGGRSCRSSQMEEAVRKFRIRERNRKKK